MAARLVRFGGVSLRAALGLAVASAAAPPAAGEFVYASFPNVGDIRSARFVGNFAGLTAHRRFATTEVNRVRLLDPARVAAPADLSEAFFGNVAFNNPTRIAQGPRQTGTFDATIPNAFFPVLIGGRVDLVALFTDTLDSAFAIDALYLEIDSVSRGLVRSFYGSGLDGFLLNPPVALGANLPDDVQIALPSGRTGTGFDETVSSKAIDTPTPGVGGMVLVGAGVLGLRRRRRASAGDRAGMSRRAVAASLAAGVIAAQAGAQPVQGDALFEPAPELDPELYQENELLWTFTMPDAGTASVIRSYLGSPAPSGPGVVVLQSWEFSETGTMVVHTTTPPCRSVRESLQVGVLPLPPSGVCGPVDAAPGLVLSLLQAVEPNYAASVRQVAPGRKIVPSGAGADPGFPSQWSLNNAGRLDGFVYADRNGDGLFTDGADGLYIDKNKDGVVDAADQLVLGAAAPNGTALVGARGPGVNGEYLLTFGADAVTGAPQYVFYRDVNGNGRLNVGDRRVFVDAAFPALVVGGIAIGDPEVNANVFPQPFLLRAQDVPTKRGTIDADIDAPQAWAQTFVRPPLLPRTTADCGDTVVGVIDSGIDTANPDLAGNISADPGRAWVMAECHDERVAVNGEFDPGELVYLDADGSRDISVGDERLTPGPGNVPPAGPVAAGDAAIGGELAQFNSRFYLERWVDSNLDGSLGDGDTFFADRTGDGVVGPGTTRLRGPVVAAGTPLLVFDARHKHRENVRANGLYDTGEIPYFDTNSNGTIDAGDVRLTGGVRRPAPPGGFYAQFSAVAAGDADAALPAAQRALTAFAVRLEPEWHAEGVNANARFDSGEWIVVDRDGDRTISLGDVRLTQTNAGAAYAPGTVVAPLPGGANPADLGTALVPFRFGLDNDSVRDIGGHGTSVASVIGARGNNGVGIAGVCWETRLLPLRALGGFYGYRTFDAAAQEATSIDRFINAVAYASNLAGPGGANRRIVLNYSAGREGRAHVGERAVVAAANARKVVLVVAARNAPDDLDNDPKAAAAGLPAGTAFDFPTALADDPGTPNVISVGGSTNQEGRIFAFGRRRVSIGAPAEKIVMLQNRGGGDTLVIEDGCSFAAPHVAGIFAHAIRLFPELYNAPGGHLTIKDGFVLSKGFVDSRSGLGNAYAAGLRNAGRARMVQGVDFGDAPAPYPTLARDPAVRAARHRDVNEEWLGLVPNLPGTWFKPDGVPVVFPNGASNVSPEFDADNRPAAVGPAPAIPLDPDGQQNLVQADAFDDGVRFLTPLMWSAAGQPPRNATVRFAISTENAVRVVNGVRERAVDANAGRYPEPGGAQPNPLPGVADATDTKFLWLNMWIDFNRDNDWDDAGERVLVMRINPSEWSLPGPLQPPTPGAVYTINFPMPERPANVQPGETQARVRLDYGENAGVAFPDPASMRPTTAANVGFANTAPGALVRLYSDAGGLPNAGPYVRNRWEAPPSDSAADGGVILVRNFAQFGEVEDHRVELFPAGAQLNPDQLHLSGPPVLTEAFTDFTIFVQRQFVGLPGQRVDLRVVQGPVWVPVETTETLTTDQYGVATGTVRVNAAGPADVVIEVKTGSLTAYYITRVPGTARPPCPADYDRDGVLAPADIFAFLTGYFARDAAADFDANTLHQPADIFAFLSAYFAGGC